MYYYNYTCIGHSDWASYLYYTLTQYCFPNNKETERLAYLKQLIKNDKTFSLNKQGEYMK